MIWHLLQMHRNIWLTCLIQKGKQNATADRLFVSPHSSVTHKHNLGIFPARGTDEVCIYKLLLWGETAGIHVLAVKPDCNQLPRDSTADSFTGFTCYYSKNWEPKTSQTPDEAWHFTMAHGLSLHLPYNNPCTPSRTLIRSYISVFLLFSSLLILFGFPLLDFSFFIALFIHSSFHLSFLVVARILFFSFSAAASNVGDIGHQHLFSPLSSLSPLYLSLSVQINLSFSVFWSIPTLSTTSSSRLTLYIPTSAWTHSLPSEVKMRRSFNINWHTSL